MPKKYLVGKCGFCEHPIFSNQKFEVLFCARPLPNKEDYYNAPIHNRCRMPMLKRFNDELMRDIKTLTWMVDTFTKKEEQNGNK